MKTILIDNREILPDRGGLPIYHELQKMGAPVQIEQLESGDFVMNDCALEHKTIEDFSNSLYNNHLFNQINTMQLNFRHYAIIVTASPHQVMTSAPLIGAVASCAVRGAPVHFCSNPQLAARFIFSLLNKWNDGKDRTINPSINQKLTKDTALNMITGIKGISQEKGLALLEHFGSISLISQATEKDLMEVSGIGKKMAANIYNAFHEPRW